MTGKTNLAIPSRATLLARLADEIVIGRLSAGTKLSAERELAAQCGVSRPVVREALRSLAERHLVEVRPGRGTFIRAARQRRGGRARRPAAPPATDAA